MEASMRPGQAAPVFGVIRRALMRHMFASMRPGQAAPVFGRVARGEHSQLPCFNEAGAGCPGIRSSGVGSIPERR